jgi:hypothetical protein
MGRYIVHSRFQAQVMVEIVSVSQIKPVFVLNQSMFFPQNAGRSFGNRAKQNRCSISMHDAVCMMRHMRQLQIVADQRFAR